MSTEETTAEYLARERVAKERLANAGGYAFGGSGLTMRDWFAGQALKGFLSGPMTKEARDIVAKEFTSAELVLGTWQAVLAARAYGYADAMLAERSK